MAYLKTEEPNHGTLTPFIIRYRYDEDADVMFLNVDGSTYMVQLMQSRKLKGTLSFAGYCNPFRSFCTPGDCSSLILIL
jgi:hypothetical protein